MGKLARAARVWCMCLTVSSAQGVPCAGVQVRGYNVGELAACRSFVEGAVELRLPLPVRTVICSAYSFCDNAPFFLKCTERVKCTEWVTIMEEHLGA